MQNMLLGVIFFAVLHMNLSMGLRQPLRAAHATSRSGGKDPPARKPPGDDAERVPGWIDTSDALDAVEDAQKKAQRAEETAEETVDKTLDDVKASQVRTVDKLKRLHVILPRQFKEDVDEMRSTFLPEYVFKPGMIERACITVLLSLLWFGFYYSKFYRTDRDEGLDYFGYQKDAQQIASSFTTPMIRSKSPHGDTNKTVTHGLEEHPDLMLVFPHPELPALKAPEGGEVSDEHSGDSGDSGESSSDSDKGPSAKQKSALQRKNTEALELGIEQSFHAPKSAQLREKVIGHIRKVYSEMIGEGYDVHIFSSVDDDEIYCSVSLRKPDIIEHSLVLNERHLQIKPDIAARLGIAQPEKEPASSPPYLRFDKKVVQRLSEALRSEDEPETSPEENEVCASELFEMHNDTADGGGCLLSSLERVDFIYNKLSKIVSLESMVNDGVLVTWYPVHNKHWIEKFHATWASSSAWKDFYFVQPISMIKEYFGSRMSFTILWNGVYCKTLLMLLPVAIVYRLAMSFIYFLGGLGSDNKTEMMGFLIILLLWARLAANLWECEQEFFIKLWEIDPNEHRTDVRPEFKGEEGKSVVDANQTEKQEKPLRAFARRFLSRLVTGFFIALVCVCIMIWRMVFENDMNLLACILLSLMIKIFEVIWNIVSVALTNFENHRLEEDHFNAYLWKQFLFQAVNNYSAFILLAVRQQSSDAGCPPGGCLELLRKQLATVLVILTACKVATVVAYSAIVKLMLRYEDYMLLRSLNFDEEAFAKRQRHSIEEQSKYAEYGTREQVEAQLQLVLSLGFVLLFGAVEPMTVPLCLTVFVVNLHATSYFLTNSAKRTMPHSSAGLGAWNGVVQLLMILGVLFQGVLLVMYGESFTGARVVTKLTGIMMFCVGMFALWYLVGLVWSPSSSDVKVLAARRKYTAKKVMQKADVLPKVSWQPSSKDRRRHQCHTSAMYYQIVALDSWGEINRFDGSHTAYSVKADEGSESVSGTQSSSAGRSPRSLGVAPPH